MEIIIIAQDYMYLVIGASLSKPTVMKVLDSSILLFIAQEALLSKALPRCYL